MCKFQLVNEYFPDQSTYQEEDHTPVTQNFTDNRKKFILACCEHSYHMGSKHGSYFLIKLLFELCHKIKIKYYKAIKCKCCQIVYDASFSTPIIL